MKTKEIESLLRRANPRPLPSEWKEQILDSAFPVKAHEKKPLLPRLAWSALAACWAVILLLHATTPVVPQGTIPFDPIAYAERDALIRRFASMKQGESGDSESSSKAPARQKESPPREAEPLHIESSFRLRAPHASFSSPRA